MATTKYGALFPHVAPRGKELVHILVHGAANLPLINNHTPKCYVTAQTQTSMNQRDIGEIINATNYVEGVSPHWNEMIYAEIPDDRVQSEDLILFILDQPTNNRIAEFRLPWRWFVPFYQYHFNLQKLLTQTSQTLCLYVSIMDKRSALSKENIQYFGLETLLNGLDVGITSSQSIYAAARIVPDFKSYKLDYLMNAKNENRGIDFIEISAPSDQYFVLPDYSYDGYPQLSLASKKSKLPIWKHDFLFSHDNEKDNMFSNHAGALIIEFYPMNNIANSTSWRISGLLGWTAIILDSRLFHALSSLSAVEGMRTEGLLVNSEGDLTAESAKHVTCELVLRLVTERHPTKNLLSPSANNPPVLPSYYNHGIREDGSEPVYVQVSVPKKNFLPAIQPTQPASPAIRTPVQPAPPAFLPPQLYYQPPFEHAQNPSQAPVSDNNTGIRVPRINPYDLDDIPTEYRAMLATNYPPRRDDDINGWFDYFERQVANYKQAIRRIIQDVIQLRDQHKALTAANGDLRKRVETFDKKSRVIREVFEGDKIDKAKLQDIFNRLNAKIAAQSLELKENYAKIISYEKELARRSELRAQYDALVRSVQAREVEMRLIQERLGKAEGLEDTVRRQEHVIEKLESMITNYMKQRRLGGVFSDVDRKFLSEHAALGLENQQYQRRMSAGRYTETANRHQTDLIQQNLSYQQDIAHLKARLQENAVSWGQEKAELLNRLSDLEPQPATPRMRKLKPT